MWSFAANPWRSSVPVNLKKSFCSFFPWGDRTVSSAHITTNTDGRSLICKVKSLKIDPCGTLMTVLGRDSCDLNQSTVSLGSLQIINLQQKRKCIVFDWFVPLAKAAPRDSLGCFKIHDVDHIDIFVLLLFSFPIMVFIPSLIRVKLEAETGKVRCLRQQAQAIDILSKYCNHFE